MISAANPVQSMDFVCVWLLGRRNQARDQGGQADRDVGVKNPLPTEGVDQVAGQGRREDVGCHETQRPERGGLAVTLRREGAGRDGLTQGQQRRAEDAL